MHQLAMSLRSVDRLIPLIDFIMLGTLRPPVSKEKKTKQNKTKLNFAVVFWFFFFF